RSAKSHAWSASSPTCCATGRPSSASYGPGRRVLDIASTVARTSRRCSRSATSSTPSATPSKAPSAACATAGGRQARRARAPRARRSPRCARSCSTSAACSSAIPPHPSRSSRTGCGGDPARAPARHAARWLARSVTQDSACCKERAWRRWGGGSRPRSGRGVAAGVRRGCGRAPGQRHTPNDRGATRAYLACRFASRGTPVARGTVLSRARLAPTRDMSLGSRSLVPLLPHLGHGIGLRPPHYPRVLDGTARVDWFEVISENFMIRGGRPPNVLDKARALAPVVLHGVSMNLGGTDPLNDRHLDELAQLADRFEPAWVSEHLCWGAFGRHYAHDLLPLPYTDEALAHVAERVRRVQDRLGRRILVENVSSYLTFSHSTMAEWTFLGAVA